jgi:hypothetical protein
MTILLSILAVWGTLVMGVLTGYLILRRRKILEQGRRVHFARRIATELSSESAERLDHLLSSDGQYAKVPHPISDHQLGEIEAALPGLTEVVIVADHIEDPQNALRKAVKANFQRDVHYLFLVSKRNAATEVTGYFGVFEAIAQAIITLGGKSIRVSDLVTIQQLEYDWLDYPYVFYRMSNSTTIAYRGNQVMEGIADKYVSLEPRLAHTIAQAVLNTAPSPIDRRLPVVTAEEFKEPGGLVEGPWKAS